MEHFIFARLWNFVLVVGPDFTEFEKIHVECYVPETRSCLVFARWILI